LTKILAVIIFEFDKNFNFNAGDPSLSLRMTGLCGIREGKEMAIRRQNLNFPIFSTNRHFFSPLQPKNLSFRASARNLPALVKLLLITDTHLIYTSLLIYCNVNLSQDVNCC